MGALGYQRGDGIVFEPGASKEVNLKDIRAVSCEGDNSLVGQLIAAVEFQLPGISVSQDFEETYSAYPFDLLAFFGNFFQCCVRDHAASPQSPPRDQRYPLRHLRLNLPRPRRRPRRRQGLVHDPGQ